MKTERRALRINHWSQLSREQLAYVLGQEGADANVNIFLYLSGLKMEKENLLPSFEGKEDMTFEEYGEWLDLVEELLNGKKVCLTAIDKTDGKASGAGAMDLYYADVDDLAYAAYEQTKWMEKDHSLIALPFESMKIGKHEYKMPDALLMNTTYQQYSNAQGYMTEYWRLMARVVPPPKTEETEEEDTETSVKSLSKEQMIEKQKARQKRKKKKVKAWKQPTEEEMLEIAMQMMKARAGFMASLLTPYRWKVKARFPFIFRTPMWEAESESEIRKDMAHAPAWLFDALYKQWQDNVTHFRKKFPDMFTEAKEDPNHDAFIAELGTINLVIEKGGYGCASAVYDENCVFVFKLLNDQIKEAKEIEKMNRKSKAK